VYPPREVSAQLGLFLMLLTATPLAIGLGQTHYIANTPQVGSFSLVSGGQSAKLYVDSNDFPGVRRAASDLQADMERVTSIKPELSEPRGSLSGQVVLIGTIGHSAIIDKLIQQHKLDVTRISGKWESTLIEVIAKPLPGIERALVIAGNGEQSSAYMISPSRSASLHGTGGPTFQSATKMASM